MSRQQGIAKALEAMDYGTGETAIANAKWQESERAVFREICERHGFTIRDEQKSRGYTVLTRQYAEYKENELALEQQAKSLSLRETQLADSQQQLAKDKTELNSKVEQAVKVRTAEQANQIAGLLAQLVEVTAERDELREELYPDTNYDYDLGR